LGSRTPSAPSGRPLHTLADIEGFVLAVEAELEAMDRERVGVHRAVASLTRHSGGA
jgi:hypothetical protein